MWRWVALSVNVTVKPDWWPVIIAALIGVAAAITGTILAGRLDTKRQKRLRAERLRLDWLHILLRAAKDVYYGAFVAKLQLEDHMKGGSKQFPKQFADAEWNSTLAVGDLGIFARPVGREEITKAANEMMERASDVRKATSLEALNEQMNATRSAFNLLRELLVVEIEAIISVDAHRSAEAEKPAPASPADLPTS
jgi:hypothetical protein